MAIPGDTVGEALEQFLLMSPGEMREYKPATMAESLAIKLLLQAITDEGNVTAAKIILERTAGRTRQAEAQGGNESPLAERLKEIGIWKDRE